MAIDCKELKFSYNDGNPILSVDAFKVVKGEKVFLYGPSGCGKTTFLNLLSGLKSADSGSLSVLGTDVSSMSNSSRDRFRAVNIGVIYQRFNLVPYLTVEQNILLASTFGRKVSGSFDSLSQEANYLAKYLGVADLLSRQARHLSIGQQQRVAAARALIGSPGLVLADEPTSSLDSDARTTFLELLFKQSNKEGSTLVFVSHDRSLATMFDRQVSLADINGVRAASYSEVI